MLMALMLLFVQQATVQTPPDTARLVVANRTVTVFRTSLGALSPEERAAAAHLRIDSAVARHGDSVHVTAAPEGMLVWAGSLRMFVVTPGDVRSANRDSLVAMANDAAENLRQAIHDARDARSLKAILIGFGLAVLATAILVFLLRGLAAVRRKLLARVRPFATKAAPQLEFRGTPLLRANQIAKIARHTVNWTTGALAVLALYIYTGYVLTRFPWTRPAGEALGNYLGSTLAQGGTAVLHAVPKLFTIFLIFVAMRFASGIIRTFFTAVAQQRIVIPGIHPDTALPTRRIVNGLLWMFAIVVAYPFVPGSESAAFKGVSVFTGLLITLGSAGLVGQAMSGLVLMYSRSFRVGQYIQAGDVQGTVMELGLLATRLRTPKNEIVTLPNSVVTGAAVTNYSAATEYGHPLFIYSSVTIGYDAPWRKVQDLLITAASTLDAVMKDPAPYVLQRALDDSYVEYQVNAAIDAARSAELPMLYAKLHAAIQDTFAGAKVEIMSPRYLSMRDGNKSTVPEGPAPAGPAQ